MKTIPSDKFKTIVDNIMRDYAPLMRRLAAYEAISHLPIVRDDGSDEHYSNAEMLSTESDKPENTSRLAL